MNRQDYLSVLITFGFGFVAGFYLYLVGFSPAFGEGRWLPEFTLGPAVQEQPGWRIVGDMYGGCLMSRSCASFELRDDRSYRYVNEPGADVETGIIPQDLMDELRDALNQAPLLRYSEPIEQSDCRSYVDGLDYRYTIEARRETYALDTCKTALSEGSVLNEALTDLWEYFEN